MEAPESGASACGPRATDVANPFRVEIRPFRMYTTALMDDCRKQCGSIVPRRCATARGGNEFYFFHLVSSPPQQRPQFRAFVGINIRTIWGAKRGGFRDDPEFWRLQAQEARKQSQWDIARQYERIAEGVAEQMKVLEKRAPAASVLRRVSTAKKNRS
jgi:hypothetical protein